MNNIKGNPNDILKPDLKTLLNERQKLDNRRKVTKGFFERMKISAEISSIDKQIAKCNLKTK